MGEGITPTPDGSKDPLHSIPQRMNLGPFYQVLFGATAFALLVNFWRSGGGR